MSTYFTAKMHIQVSSGRVDFPGLFLESWVLIPHWNSDSQEMPETVTTDIAYDTGNMIEAEKMQSITLIIKREKNPRLPQRK